MVHDFWQSSQISGRVKNIETINVLTIFEKVKKTGNI
jgi:hypothetical protein